MEHYQSKHTTFPVLLAYSFIHSSNSPVNEEWVGKERERERRTVTFIPSIFSVCGEGGGHKLDLPMVMKPPL